MQKSAIKSVRDTFNSRRRLRSWRKTQFGGMKAGVCQPLSICRFRPDEGGTSSVNVHIKLAPVSGYMRSKVYVELVRVFVPYQAIEKMHWLHEKEDAGVTEMAKRRLMSGQGVGLQGQNTITRALDVHPRRVGESQLVSRSIPHAYNAAVTHLRKAAYHAADEVDRSNDQILPAVLSANVLQRFNGVLDPERNIDGAINLTGELPVKGIGVSTTNVAWNEYEMKETGAEHVTQNASSAHVNRNNVMLREDPDNPGYPLITVDTSGASEITLRDMVESQKLDQLVREFAKMIQDDPVNGEEKVERALYGLTCDFDDNCQVLYRKTFELSAQHQRPMDGQSINEISAHFEMQTRVATVVPRSELGGQLLTIAMVKPLETLKAQPDPAQTEVWEVVNRVHDETQLDEQLLVRADLESSVSAENADQPAFWVGHNGLKHHYDSQGPNEFLMQGVETQSSMWVYEIPTSVTPSNVSYDVDALHDDMYPFYNWNGDHAEFTVTEVAAISTSLAKGPNPVEKIQLFADDASLLEAEE